MAITTVSSHVVSVNAIQGTLIADNAITAVHIATNAVSGTLIADNAVTATHIAQNTITVTQIADDAIEAAKLADGIITTNHLNKAMISSQTEVTAVAGDFLLIGDTSDSNNLKKIPISGITALVDVSSKLNLSGGTLTGGIVIGGDSSINRGNQTSGELLIGGTTDGGFLDFDGSALQLNTQRDPNTGTFINTSKSHGGITIVGNDADSHIKFYTASANNTTGTERMRIDSSGNVLVGTTTFNNLSTESGVLASNNVVMARGSLADHQDACAVLQYSSDTTWLRAYGDTAGSGLMVFRTGGGAGSTDTEKMRIHASGCVGIGSTTDRSIDTNVGTLVVNGSAGGGLWLSPGDSSAMTSKIYAEANGSVGDLIINNGTGVGSGGMRFQTNAAQKMMLDSAGRLLINKTSSSLTYGKLQVGAGGETAGHGGIVFFEDTDTSVGSSNVIQVNWFTGDNDATGGVFNRFRDGNSVMGEITAANGTQVSYGVSSDERLKENIVDASSQLNTIKNIKVREFDWRANGYHEVGMIAQELHSVIPSAVQEGLDDVSEKPWSVDYGKLTPYLIKAVQEQQTIIEDLKSRKETLEG